MKLDTAAKVAKLSSKEEVGYGACVLATGANVRRLRVPGAQLEGIHYLRALGNADAIRADAAEASQRRAGRRLLHRLRGRGLADRDGQALHDGDARGRAAVDPLRARGRGVLRGPAALARDRARVRRPARRASRATGARGAGADRVRPLARRRPRRDGHGRGARRDARPQRRARARRDRRRGLLLDARDLGGRRVVRRRRLRVRLRAARPPRADRALGGRPRPGQGRRRRGRGPRRRLRRGALLLVGHRGLGHGRVRRRRGRPGTARSSAARSTTASSPCSTSRARGSSPRCRSGAPRTSCTPGGCWPPAARSRRRGARRPGPDLSEL